MVLILPYYDYTTTINVLKTIQQAANKTTQRHWMLILQKLLMSAKSGIQKNFIWLRT